LAENLLLLSRDAALYERISKAGAAFASNEFSADKQIANIENLYREACRV
jgi:glycosyltransferase involved in cell wall biosynthesis